jgi:hypothetical protein
MTCNRRTPATSCGCVLRGEWDYVAETCSLSFFAFVKDCVVVADHSTVDLTLVVEDSSGPVGESFYSGGTLVWFRFLPTPGETYTGTLTLVCDGETLTYIESFTVPQDADESFCNCCDERKIVSVSISGYTGDCCSWMNGTYAMSGLTTLVCRFTTIPDPAISYAEPDVADQCDEAAACYSFSHPYTDVFGGGTDTFFYFPESISMSASVPGRPLLGSRVVGLSDFTFQAKWYVYRLRTPIFGSPVCSKLNGTVYVYEFRASCNTEGMELHSKTDSVSPQSGVPAQTLCPTTPTISIEIVDR